MRSEIILSLLLQEGSLVELHFAQRTENRSIFDDFFETLNDFLQNGNSLKSLILEPRQMEAIQPHISSYLPLKFSSISSLAEVQHLTIQSSSSAGAIWITGWLSDGSLVVFERETFFFSERITRLSSNLGDLLLNNVFGMKKNLVESSRFPDIVHSALLNKRWLCSLSREGVVRIFDLLSPQKKVVLQESIHHHLLQRREDVQSLILEGKFLYFYSLIYAYLSVISDALLKDCSSEKGVFLLLASRQGRDLSDDWRVSLFL